MKELISKIKQRIELIEFSKLWNGFKPYRFALYDDKKVYLGNEEFEVDDRFIGNTSIKYNDECIAIWKIMSVENINIDVLTSKIIHEMFHAYQQECQEKRWPNEIKEGLGYDYIVQNLSIKYLENQLLVDLIDNFDKEKFTKFLLFRKFRNKHFNKEFSYETKVEVIEGMAEFIELKALKILNNELYDKKIIELKNTLRDVNNLIPIRIINYNIGALLLLICDNNNISFYHDISNTTKTIYELLSSGIKYQNINVEDNTQIVKVINNYYNNIKEKINSLINNSKKEVEGDFSIIGLDPLNSVKYGNNLYCKHFLAYKDDNNVKFIKKECVAFIDSDYSIKKIIF